MNTCGECVYFDAFGFCDNAVDKMYCTNVTKETEACESFEQEFDCNLHGKLGGIDECPRC